MSNFNELSLDQTILKTLQEIGYETPTPIQKLAIPQVIKGSDIIASAQTGTGKTGAFLLPAIQLLTKNNQNSPKGKGPRVLVLAPTRELAMQIAAEAEKFSRNVPKLRTVCVYGGVPYPPQIRSLSRPYDILVATPGRLLDHMERRLIDLSRVQLLVLDEADRMLDMGFIEPVEYIASRAPKDRQTLLFSATIDKKILGISQKLQNNPVEIKIEPDDLSKSNIEQQLYYVDNLNHKIKLLDHLMEKKEMEQAIIFISTKRQADEMARALRDKNYLAEALHGDMNQRQRSRTIEKLRRGHIRFIIATDVAARGIDIPALTHVINIDLPFKPEDYVHRIGRTGRAGAKGTAITFATHQEERLIFKINKLLNIPMNILTIEGLEPKTPTKTSENRRRNKPRFHPSQRFKKNPKKKSGFFSR